ncbi:MAG: MerR family transcriptional regulator [Firmicutes bacterium]|nr:MerR family transcriptional regulator [Bacillota bacterium]
MSATGKTLSQAASDVGVEPSTIKYWCEEFSNFIRPARTQGGHRRFNEQDIQDLLYLRRLLHEQNFSIKQAKAYLNEPEDLSIESANADVPTPLHLIAPPTTASTQELGQYLEKRLQLITGAQLQAIQATIEQTAATLLEHVQESDTARFHELNNIITRTAQEANEELLAAVEETKQSPEELNDARHMYTEARDRWLTEEAKVRMEIQRLKHELENIQSQSFWQRLRWAFLGHSKQSNAEDSSHNADDPKS